MRDKYLRWLIYPFPPNSIFRIIGKRLVSGLSLKQNFYNGVIYFDAVSQSWAFKGNSYETIDIELRNELLSLSRECHHFIDIGCNIGTLTLFLLLMNSDIHVVSVDPNAKVLALLKKSLRANRFEHRAIIKHAAVSTENGSVHFSSPISEQGHISISGKKVDSLSFSDLLNKYSSRKCLVKIDVEGFETTLLKTLGHVKNLHNLCLVVELHSFGYNDGNPQECINLLKNSGASLKRVDGLEISKTEQTKITQIIAQWNR